MKYIGNLYLESQTQIAVNRRVSSPINVNRGVKQGDPLSCFLFNLVVDRCLRKLDPLLGIELSSDVRVRHLAFADDIVLLSEKPALLQRLVDQFTTEASSVGLEANAEKCASMDIRVHKRKVGRRWVVHPRPSVRILGHDIRPLSATGAYKYLGVNVTARRRDDVAQQRKSCLEQLKAGLANISEAPLKPQQRFKILRENLLPKLTHKLVLVRPTKDLLMRLDVEVRRYVGKWLHLPHSTSKAYYHAKTDDGGLGLVSFVGNIPELRERRLLYTSGTDVSNWLLNSSRWGKQNIISYALGLNARVHRELAIPLRVTWFQLSLAKSSIDLWMVWDFGYTTFIRRVIDGCTATVEMCGGRTLCMHSSCVED